MTSFAFMCRSWPYRGSCTYTTPIHLVTSVSHTQNAGTLLLVGRYERLHQMLGTTLPRVPGMKNPLAKQFSSLHFRLPCPTAPDNPSVLITLGPYRSQLEKNFTTSSLRIASADGRTCSLLPARYLQLQDLPTFWRTALFPSGDAHKLSYQITDSKSAPSLRQPLTNFSTYTNSR